MSRTQTWKIPLRLFPLAILAACGQAADNGSDTANVGTEAEAVEVVAADRVTTSQFEYQDLCEASAAVVLDDTHFVVASDDAEEIAVYERGKASSLSKLERKGITDIEGAARIGDQIVWLASHSLNKNGEDKPKRKALFATTAQPGRGFEDTGLEITDLRQRMASRLGIKEEELVPWLNAEGLAADRDGNLLIGLRGVPKAEGDAELEKSAYVIRISNPFGSVDGPMPAATGKPGPSDGVWRLDLGGSGIRSLERVGEGARSYLVLAGPRSDGAGKFSLYWWDGKGETVSPGPSVDFGDMTPEALIAWGDGEIQILGDNEGDGDRRCSEKKDDNRPRWFPSLSFAL